jgi:two-component system nitrate/nitrite response regulator NarL
MSESEGGDTNQNRNDSAASEVRTGRYRLLLADDNPEILRQAADLLSRHFDIIGAAVDGSALLELAAKTRPDVVVADVYMPCITGFDSCLRILQDGFCDSVILLSMYSNPDLVQDAMRSGVRGYVLKEDAGEELCQAVETAMAGGVYLSAGARRILSGAESRSRNR